jgi:Secretion system C-terminal sorting domain
MRVLTLVLFILVVHKVFSQDGPGGVATRDGTSDLLLWLSSSDFGTHGYLAGDGVYTWLDLSGFNAHATTIENSPEFIPDFINGIPVLQFQSSNLEYLNGILNSIPFSPLTLIAVANFSSAQPMNTGQYVIGLGGGMVSIDDQASISRQASNASPYPHAYYSFERPSPPPTRSIGPELTSDRWYGFMALYNTSVPYHSLYLDNFSQVIINDFQEIPDWGNQNFDIGRNGFGLTTSYLDGGIAEIIIFNGALNTVERNILFNYLSAKYALVIDNDLYSYDAAPDNFDLEVVGIGSESGNIQNTAVSGGLTINTDDAFGGTTDPVYVLWGHRILTNTVNTFDIEETSDQLDARWSRTWGIDVTNSPSNMVTVDLSFDFQSAGIGGTPSTATNYYLIRSLGVGLGWEIVSTGSSIVGNAINFENVTISDGIYTLATGNQPTSLLSNVNITSGNGPAGIGSTTGNDIALWLDASQLTLSDGSGVATWPDLTNNGRNATQATGANQPTFETNELNGLGIVRFNGTTSFMAGSLGPTFNAPFTLFAVARFAQVNQGADDNDYVFDLGAPGPGTLGTKASISRRRNNDAIARTNRYYSFQGATPQYGPVINGGLGNVHAFGAVYQLRSPFQQLYYNGTLSFAAPSTTVVNSNGVYHLGRLNNTADVNYFLDGDIAEVIVYNSVLSSTQIRIIQSYLAAKWGFVLSGEDIYTGDDVINGNNDLDISGVGRSLDGDVGITTSAGMTVRLGADAEAESFVMFGHSIVTNEVNTTDIDIIGDIIFQRSNRAWYFDITGNTGSTDSINFDFSDMGLTGTPGDPNNYVLIHRSGTSGAWSIVATASDTDGDQVYFTGVNLTLDGFYTLASINNAPLPVSLLSFDAKVVTEGKTNSVLLKWQTASELNNDYFTLERSVDGKKWISMLALPGKGTFNGLSSYESLDQNPPAGKVYYRLKQTDLDGQAKYVGGIRMVTIRDEEIDVNIFPNPSIGFINVLSKRGMLNNAELIVTDFTGKEMLTRNLSNEYQEQVQLTLKPGLYLISIKKNNLLLYSQRLMINE